MPKQTSHKAILPFNDFLGHLRRQGFVITTDHYLRLQTLLNALGTDCAPSDLKHLLCPIFATDPKQQDQFYRAFELKFKSFEYKEKKSVPSRQKKDVSERLSETPKVSKLPYVLLGLILIVSGIYLFPLKEEPLPEDIKKPETQTTTAPFTTTSLPVTLPGGEEKPAETLNPPEQPAPLPAPESKEAPTPQPQKTNWQGIARIAAISLLIVFLLTELYLFSRRRLVLQRQKDKKPPFIWTIETPDTDFIKDERLYAAARSMRRRVTGEVYRLDVNETVRQTTASGGLPTFCYQPITRPPEYLFLIDLAAYRDHQGHFFAHMAKALADEDLFVFTYFYKHNPRVCFQEEHGERIYLTNLRRKFSDKRLIIVGNGNDLLDPVSGELSEWTSLFDTWEDRAILSPERPRDWGLKQQTLAQKFIVLPAGFDGLAALVDHFEFPSKLNLRGWKTADARLSDLPPDPPDDPDALREYLGDDAFQWLCACAVYPELQWGLTLYLGRLPEMPEDLVCEKNLLRLIHLPWFCKGRIPDELRWKLIRALDEDRVRNIRDGIAELFEKNPPPRHSFAYDAFHLNLAVQEWVLSPKRLRSRWKLRKKLEGVGESQMAQDYALVRLLESVPKSPLSLELPQRIRSIFYKDGMFVLGLKTGIRFAVTLFVVIFLFLVTGSEKMPEMPMPGTTTTTNVLSTTELVLATSVADTTTVMPETSVISTTTFASPGDMKAEIIKGLEMKFVYIPPGEFMMGSPEDEPKRDDDEKQHKVKITKGFYMQTTEVTQGQWRAIMGENPSYFGKCGDNCPVENVSWNDVQEFISKLNKLEKTDKYRLPTEAEWEYAARSGGKAEKYAGFSDDDRLYEYANFCDRNCKYDWKDESQDDGYENIAPVGSFKPNGIGLYDMSGNVWEWCQDWYGDYPSGSVSDPTGPSSAADRVLRGGSWGYSAEGCRSDDRYGRGPSGQSYGLGFRLALSPGQQVGSQAGK